MRRQTLSSPPLRSIAFALLFAASLGPVPARAGDEAAGAFARGKQLFESRDYVAAVAAFETAYKLRPHHAVQCSIARCYENLNRAVEAAEHYRRCLKEGAEKTAIAARIRTSLRDAERRITWLDVLSPRAAGTIFLDGVPVGLTPRRLALNPGRHAVEVRREGASPARATVDTLGGEQRTVVLEPGAPSPSSGPVSPPPPRLVAPTPEAPPAETPVQPRGRRRLHPAWFWAAAGASVALAGTATALGVLTLKKQTAYNEQPTKDALDSFKQHRLITNLLWGITAAAAGTCTTLFFFTDFGGEARRSRVAGAGVGIGGVF